MIMKKLRKFKVWFLCLLGVMMVVCSCWFYNNQMEALDWSFEQRGQFGDSYGALNALFSGLAFFGLIVALVLQSRDLSTQTEALRLQIDEFKAQKHEMAKAADAQIEMTKVEKVKLKIEVEKVNIQHISALLSSQPDRTQIEFEGQRDTANNHFIRVAQRMKRHIDELNK